MGVPLRGGGVPSVGMDMTNARGSEHRAMCPSTQTMLDSVAHKTATPLPHTRSTFHMKVVWATSTCREGEQTITHLHTVPSLAWS